MRSNPVGLDSTGASATVVDDRESCLETNDLAALIDGDLRGTARADAEAHVDQCPRCRKLLVGLAHDKKGAVGRPEFVLPSRAGGLHLRVQLDPSILRATWS